MKGTIAARRHLIVAITAACSVIIAGASPAMAQVEVKLTASAKHDTVPFGSTTLLRGKTQGISREDLSGGEVLLYAIKWPYRDKSLIGPVKADATGNFSFRVKPSVNTLYRAVWRTGTGEEYLSHRKVWSKPLIRHDFSNQGCVANCYWPLPWEMVVGAELYPYFKRDAADPRNGGWAVWMRKAPGSSWVRRRHGQVVVRKVAGKTRITLVRPYDDYASYDTSTLDVPWGSYRRGCFAFSLAAPSSRKASAVKFDEGIQKPSSAKATRREDADARRKAKLFGKRSLTTSEARVFNCS